MRPLEGIRILDLSKVLAGPLCGQYLGDLGADVIKVEPPVTGDETRGWLPQTNGESASFMAVNHNKRGLALDLKSPEGNRIIQKLAQQADVVIQGFGAGTAARLGVDYDTLRILNPRLVYCEISGYGRNGPLGAEPGYDVMLQAFSGMVNTIGQKNGPAARVSFSPVDLGTGLHAVSGILAALMNRNNTNEGAYVEVSLLDTAMGFMSYMAHNYWSSGVEPARMGTSHPSLCPYQAFETKDGEFMLGVGNDRHWQRFCKEAGLDAYANDAQLKTNAQRVNNFDYTCSLVQEALKQDTTQSWLMRLQKAGVPCSPLHTLSQALEHEQTKARNIIVESPHPTLGTLHHVAYPVTFNNGPRNVKRAPPLLGQHTGEILESIGYNQQEIEQLIEQGIVGSLNNH